MCPIQCMCRRGVFTCCLSLCPLACFCPAERRLRDFVPKSCAAQSLNPPGPYQLLPMRGGGGGSGVRGSGGGSGEMGGSGFTSSVGNNPAYGVQCMRTRTHKKQTFGVFFIGAPPLFGGVGRCQGLIVREVFGGRPPPLSACSAFALKSQ